MADINTLVELNRLGYNKEFFESCVDKGYFASKQTVMNAISKMTALGILSYKRRGERIINREVFRDTWSPYKVLPPVL